MASTRTINIILFSCLVLAVSAETLLAQDVEFLHVYGDSTFKKRIIPKTRAIYDQGGEWVFILSRENLLDIEGAYATELQATHLDGHFNRIIATGWATEGKYSMEFYLDVGTLVFVYESFEYFEESVPQMSWRNFKGLAGWERRSYFDGFSIGYVEAVGDVEPAMDGVPLIETVNRLLAVLEKRRH